LELPKNIIEEIFTDFSPPPNSTPEKEEKENICLFNEK
jgi:hypothetical protein